MDKFMELSSELVKILTCPVTGGKLIYDKKNKMLISESAGLMYPIIDGIPMLLTDKAKKIPRDYSKEAPVLETNLSGLAVKKNEVA